MRVTLKTKIYVIKGKESDLYYTLQGGICYVGQYFSIFFTNELDAKNELAELQKDNTPTDRLDELEIVETTLWDLQRG